MNTEILHSILQKVEEMNISEGAYLEFTNMMKNHYEKKLINEQPEKYNKYVILKSYENSLNAYNDADYWKKTPYKERNEYFASVYGSNAYEQQHITERMNEHLKKAYKRFENKMLKVK